MKFKSDFLPQYLREAPSPLAIERSLECAILSEQEFTRPILDLGCGEGLFSFILFDEKIDVGIDPNGREIERAKQYGMYDELIECFGDTVPKSAGYFNTIMSNSVLEHIPDLEPVLQEARRLLAPGGKFYLTVPTDLFDRYSVIYRMLSFLRLAGLAERYRLFFNSFWRHHHFHDEAGWRGIFQRAGFTVAIARKYATRKTCLLNDALAPFSIPSLLQKRLFNRWFLLKPLRALYAPVLDAALRPVVRSDRASADCGLIFFCLTKP